MLKGWRIDRNLTLKTGRGRERDADLFGDGIAPCPAPEVAFRIALPEPGETGRLRGLFFTLGEVLPEGVYNALVSRLN